MLILIAAGGRGRAWEQKTSKAQSFPIKFWTRAVRKLKLFPAKFFFLDLRNDADANDADDDDADDGDDDVCSNERSSNLKIFRPLNLKSMTYTFTKFPQKYFFHWENPGLLLYLSKLTAGFKLEPSE